MLSHVRIAFGEEHGNRPARSTLTPARRGDEMGGWAYKDGWAERQARGSSWSRPEWGQPWLSFSSTSRR